MRQLRNSYGTMRHRYQTLLFFCLAVAFVLAGCDQSAQKADPESANRYIIKQGGTSAGDATTGSFSGANEVSVPDTVDYYVQGYTVDKSYTWSVNDSDLPTASSSEQTYRWESRGGEFITVMYTADDPIASTTATSDPSTVSISVNASPDDINAETIEVEAAVRDSIGGQVARIGSFSTLATLAVPSGIAGILGQTQSTFTLFGPSNASLASGGEVAGALGGVPTQAVDADEPRTSSVRADLVKYHAVQGNAFTSEDLPVSNVETLLGNTTVSVDESMVSDADIPATNGVIHELNTPLLPPVASADFTDRALPDTSVAQGDTIVVDGVYMPADGGFVVLHDKSELQSAGAVASTVGVSDYIEGPTVANEVKVALDEELNGDVTLGAMPHKDSNDNEQYDFATPQGVLTGNDTPYQLEGNTVIDYAEITVEPVGSN